MTTPNVCCSCRVYPRSGTAGDHRRQCRAAARRGARLGQGCGPTANADTARTAYAAFERVWNKRWPGVVTSLREGGDELLTFVRFRKTQWKTLRTTNTIERLHSPALQPRGERQIKLRKIDGWRKIAAMLSQHTAVAT